MEARERQRQRQQHQPVMYTLKDSNTFDASIGDMLLFKRDMPLFMVQTSATIIVKPAIFSRLLFLLRHSIFLYENRIFPCSSFNIFVFSRLIYFFLFIRLKGGYF